MRRLRGIKNALFYFAEVVMFALEPYARLWGVETPSLAVWHLPLECRDPLTGWSGSRGRMSRFSELKVHGTG